MIVNQNVHARNNTRKALIADRLKPSAFCSAVL